MAIQDYKDFRNVPNKDKNAIRKFVIQQILNGLSLDSVAKFLNVSFRTIIKWIGRYSQGGFDALNNRKKTGRPGKLSESQMQWILNTVRDKTPRQMRFEFACWTVNRVRHMIFQKFKVRVGESTVRRVLRLPGLTPPRPVFRAYQRKEEEVRLWIEGTFPSIVHRATETGAMILFVDEAGMRSDHRTIHTWGERGKTPVLKATGSRFGMNMLSALSPDGSLSFMLNDGPTTGEVFSEFPKRTHEEAGVPIHVIADNLSIHKAKPVKEMLESMPGMIEIHYLPAYSPELNPDELVWSLVKREVSQYLVQTKEELVARLTTALHTLKESREKVKALFAEPHCAYILP